jgi:hypothetical protein
MLERAASDGRIDELADGMYGLAEYWRFTGFTQPALINTAEHATQAHGTTVQQARTWRAWVISRTACYSELLRREPCWPSFAGYGAHVLFAPTVAVRGCHSGDDHGLPAHAGQSVRFAVARVASIPSARLALTWCANVAHGSSGETSRVGWRCCSWWWDRHLRRGPPRRTLHCCRWSARALCLSRTNHVPGTPVPRLPSPVRMTPARRAYDKPHALLGCRIDWVPG